MTDQLSPQPDMSAAVTITCPVCQVYAKYGSACELCRGTKRVLMLPNGALFPPPKRESEGVA